jgi:SAM-dependent methyltransferase
MAFDRSRRTTFDAVAETYDAVRPGYPDELIEDAIGLSGIAPGGRILEVGCGPGTATVALARRGYDIVGVELGENLAALATTTCRPYPNVRIVHAPFEDWPLPIEPFDLVFSASAFHWIDPDVGYAKAAAALGGCGAIALCWNRHPPEESPLRRALDEAYRTIAPELTGKGGAEPLATTLQRPIDEIAASGLFSEVTMRSYRWSAEYTSDEYVRLLRTYSDHLALPEITRRALCDAIRESIEAHGGVIARPVLAVLYVARVRRRRRRPRVPARRLVVANARIERDEENVGDQVPNEQKRGVEEQDRRERVL